MLRNILFPGTIFAIFLTFLSAHPGIPRFSPDELLRSEIEPGSHRANRNTSERTTTPSSSASASISASAFRSLREELVQDYRSRVRRNRDRFPLRGTKSAVIFTKRSQLRKEICKTQVIKQVVKEKGCLRRTVVNRFCYGQCSSFYIPRLDKHNILEPAFASCSFCSPHRYTWMRVTLRCPNAQGQRFKRTKVKVIKRCKCMAIEPKLIA